MCVYLYVCIYVVHFHLSAKCRVMCHIVKALQALRKIKGKQICIESEFEIQLWYE